MSVEKLTSKIQNYQYMPGISSYGVDGKQGETGQSGNCIFYSNILFDSSDSSTYLNEIITQINNQYVLLRNSTTHINRKYQNGDYIILANGNLYELKNVESISDISNNTYKDFFTLKGHIVNDIDSSANISFSKNRGSLILTNGIDIGEGTEDINNEVLLNIIANEDVNGIVKFVNLVTKYDIENNAYLHIYYDINKAAILMDSNYPIVVNSPSLTVNSNDANSELNFDGYSSIVTYKNDISITQKYNFAKQIKYKILSSSTIYRLSLFWYNTKQLIQNYFSNAAICLTYTDINNIVRKFIFTLDEISTVNKSDYAINVSLNVSDLSGLQSLKNIISVSLIDRLEFFITKLQD